MLELMIQGKRLIFPLLPVVLQKGKWTDVIEHEALDEDSERLVEATLQISFSAMIWVTMKWMKTLALQP